MTNSLELQQGEDLIRKEVVMYIKNKLVVQSGTLYLTTKRLFFIKNQNLALGLIGLLFNSLKGGLLFNIPLNKITNYEKTRHSLNKKVLKLTLEDGQNLKFALSSTYEEWEQLLKSVGK